MRTNTERCFWQNFEVHNAAVNLLATLHNVIQQHGVKVQEAAR